VAVAEALTTPHRVPTVVNEVIGGEAAEALLVESGQGAGTSETVPLGVFKGTEAGARSAIRYGRAARGCDNGAESPVIAVAAQT